MFYRRSRLLNSVTASLTSTEFAALPSLEAPYTPPPVLLKPSVDSRQRPTILFGPAPEGTSVIPVPPEGLGSGQPLYKISSPTCDYVSVRLTMLKAGFKRIGASPRNDELPANLIWGKSAPIKAPPTGSPKERSYLNTKLAHPYQKFNHFPSSHANLGCKAGLALNLNRCHDKTKHFNPTTLVYPSQKDKINELIAGSPRHHRFIWKPARGSCGRGIMICDGGSIEAVQRMEQGIAHKIKEAEAANVSPLMYRHYVVQKYIDDPLLIDNKKFDLRLYVVVTSFGQSIVAYRHQKGFARFAASDYNEASIGEKYSHLTNFSIGRRIFEPSLELLAAQSDAAAVEAIKEASDKAAELKWSLDRLDDVLENQKSRITAASGVVVDKATMWKGVDEVIRATLHAVRPKIAQKITDQDASYNSLHGTTTSFSGSYFELYGFDVMFDSHCRPWLIEVNTLPSLESSSVRDYHLKSSVITDLLNLAMIVPFERTDAERKLFASGDLSDPADTATTNFPRVDLPRSSPAAQQFLVGEQERLTVPDFTNETTHQMRRQDEDRYKGGFIRLL